MYEFKKVNHGAILFHAVLTGLTPLIPVPFLDDWVKSGFQRRMVRQVAAARGRTPTPEEVEILIQEDFWESCAGGCARAPVYLLRELLSKIFFIIEIRRALNLVSTAYYSGFLLDAALMDGFPLGTGNTVEAVHLRDSIRRARYAANLKLIGGIFRQKARPGAIFGAAWQVTKRAVSGLPGAIASLPGAVWRSLRAAPGQAARGIAGIPRRIRQNIALRIQVLLGKERPPELVAIERLAAAMQEALLNLPPDHFDMLHARLVEELDKPQRTQSAQSRQRGREG